MLLSYKLSDKTQTPLRLSAPHTRSGSERRSAVEAIGRFSNQSPGCRQSTILAPVTVAALQPLPGSGAVSFGLGTFWMEDATSGSREASCPATRPTTGIDSGERGDKCCKE